MKTCGPTLKFLRELLVNFLTTSLQFFGWDIEVLQNLIKLDKKIDQTFKLQWTRVTLNALPESNAWVRKSWTHNYMCGPGSYTKGYCNFSLGDEPLKCLLLGPYILDKISWKNVASRTTPYNSYSPCPLVRTAHVCHSGPRARPQALQNKKSQMVILRLKTLPVQHSNRGCVQQYKIKNVSQVTGSGPHKITQWMQRVSTMEFKISNSCHLQNHY